MKIYLAADHAGFKLKQQLLPFVKELGFEVIDVGAFKEDPTDDYPDYISRAASEISNNPQNALAIVIGGSGEGEAIVANKFRHVRATVYYGGSTDIIKLSREHNDANILSLGARFLTEEQAKNAVSIWLTFHAVVEDRHKRRIRKIEAMEKKFSK